MLLALVGVHITHTRHAHDRPVELEGSVLRSHRLESDWGRWHMGRPSGSMDTFMLAYAVETYFVDHGYLVRFRYNWSVSLRDVAVVGRAIGSWSCR